MTTFLYCQINLNGVGLNASFVNDKDRKTWVVSTLEHLLDETSLNATTQLSIRFN